MEGFDLKQIIAPKGDDAMSCCFDRKKLSCADKYSLKKALSEIVLQNSEYEKELKEKKRLEDDEMLSVSKRRLQKESRTQIYGDSIRQIAKGFGRNAVICDKPKESPVIAQPTVSEEQFKKEFIKRRFKPWYKDLIFSGYIDTNAYKENPDEFTKNFYPKLSLNKGGESIDALSSRAVELYQNDEEKLNALIDKILSPTFGQRQPVVKVKKAKKAPSLPKVKYTRPSGKAFVPDSIDESAIWGNALKGNDKFFAPETFEDDIVKIEYVKPAEPHDDERTAEPKADNAYTDNLAAEPAEDKGAALVKVKAEALEPKRAHRKQKFKYTRPSGKTFVPYEIDEASIWGGKFARQQEKLDTFAEQRVSIILPQKEDKAEIAEQPVKVAPTKPKIKRKEDSVSLTIFDDTAVRKEEPEEKAEKAKPKKKKQTPPPKSQTEKEEAANNSKKEAVNNLPSAPLQEDNKGEKPKDEKPSPKKAQKKAKKGKKRVEVIHLTKEQARRRYTMPKGGSYDFNVDEASIWGATDFKKDMPNRILDLDTFEDDNVFKDVNKDKASDKNGFDAGDDKK